MINYRAFIVGVKTTRLTQKEKKFLKKYKPWGVILFTRNIKNIKQTKELTLSIRKIFQNGSSTLTVPLPKTILISIKSEMN